MRGEARSGRPLAGEVALVTGGSRGIGLSIVRKLLEAGAAVALVARDEAMLDQSVASLPVHSGSVLPIVGDVTEPRSMESAVERTVERLGSLSILVNNAGVGLYGPIAEQPLDDWRRVIETNLLGVYYATRAALPVMRERGRGQIVVSLGPAESGRWATSARELATPAAGGGLTAPPRARPGLWRAAGAAGPRR